MEDTIMKNATPHFDFESKKIYLNPTMDVIEINANVQLLAGSETKTLSDDPITDPSEILSREDDFSLFDE